MTTRTTNKPTVEPPEPDTIGKAHDPIFEEDLPAQATRGRAEPPRRPQKHERPQE